MNKLANTVTTSLSKVGLTLKKHSPEILVVSGVIGVVTSTVLACRATTKVNAVLEKAKEDIETIHEVAENPEFAEEYTVEDSKKDLAIVYAKTGLEVVKLYAPAVILGTLSITGILASNNILRKRNVALAAAYAAVDKGFKEYRNRVVDRFGEAVDRELAFNVKAQEIEETVVDEKTGKEKKVKKTVEVVGDLDVSPYAKFFDESCYYWEKDPELNLMFLRAKQQWANDLLRSRGWLFLNEVYESLDIDPTPVGQHAGWIYDPEYDGDDFVDFGIYDTYRKGSRNFVNGIEPVILLNFNAHNIYPLMSDPKFVHKFSSK
jgi:hypothetical protein